MGNGGKKTVKQYLKSEHTDRQTDKQTNIWTFRLIESIGPEGRCFENKSCFHRLLCFLAIFDIVTLCSGGLYVLYIFQSELNILCKNHSFQVFILTLDKIAYFMIRGSSWLTVGISLERYLGICYPLKYPARFRKARYFLVQT